jgi:hypothetical protein
MLKVQEYIRSHGLEKLKEVYGINYKFDAECEDHLGTRVILDYDQIESSKHKDHEIVRECRGLVLEKDTWNLIARSFPRFFNYPDVDTIDWSQPVNCTTKEDGTLINLHHYKGMWHVNTRYSFGELQVNDSPYTWKKLVAQHLDFWKLNTNTNYNYIFELVGPYNKVVVDYEPSIILLSIFEGEREFNYSAIKSIAELLKVQCVKSFAVASEADLFNLLNGLNKDDVDAEGFVIRDYNNVRSKVKHEKYMVAHRLANNGNVASPKNLVPLMMANETDELLSFKCFKYLIKDIQGYQAKIDEAWKEIDNTWFVYEQVESQKKFAELVIKATKYSSILFNARKTGRPPKEFFTSDYVLKNVFGVKP